MNEDIWNKLPPDLKQLIAKSLAGMEKEIGQAWDALDVPGKKALLDGGGEAIKLSPEEAPSSARSAPKLRVPR